MPACEPARGSAAAGTVSGSVLLDGLVVVAARRIVLGVDLTAAKLLNSQRIDGHVREQEVRESMPSWLKRAELRHLLGIGFFRDQIEADKVVQRGLRRYWGEYPEVFPVRRRYLAAELQQQFDLVNRHMLLLLIDMHYMPPVSRSRIDGLFDGKLRESPVLRRLGELRRDVADVALRSLCEAL